MEPTHQQPQVYTADTVVTGTEILRPGWIEVTDSLITGLGSGTPPHTGESKIIALGSATIVPGFVDMHVHGGGGGSFPDATAQDIEAALAVHAAHGTTTMMASLVSAQPRELMREVEVLAPYVHNGTLGGIHLEGPWLAPSKKGAHDPETLRTPDLGELARIFDAAQGAIKMVTLAPELDGAIAAIGDIVAAGAVAAVGHTNASYEETVAAIDAGARVGTHLFNAMRQVHHREPGPVTALVEDERVTVEMIGDGVHLHPSLYRGVCDLVGADRVTMVTDAMGAAGMPDGRYQLGTLDVDVINSVAHVAGTDTIAGSTATMDQLFRFALNNGSADPDEALLTAVRQTSINPARAVGFPPAGLQVGNRADFVVLDEDTQVRKVIRSGKEVPMPQRQ